jgi:heme oxygenase
VRLRKGPKTGCHRFAFSESENRTANGKLAAATRSLHEALDASMPLSDLANLQNYIRYLSINWPCAAIEEALESAGVYRILRDWDCRRRRFDLTDDLFALGAAFQDRPGTDRFRSGSHRRSLQSRPCGF